jgi:hypothetical protein
VKPRSKSDAASPPSAVQWSDDLARALAGERRKLKAFTKAYQLRVEHLESAAVERVQELVTAAEYEAAQETSLVEREGHRLRQAIADLASDRDDLGQLLAEIRQRASELNQPLPPRETEELDADELAALKHQLDEANQQWHGDHHDGSHVGSTPASPVDADDWESQKQRLLASLEMEAAAEHGSGDPHALRKEDRLTIDGAIRITDSIIAARDREIIELRRILEQQSRDMAATATTMHAHEETLSADEVVVQERERLKKAHAEFDERRSMAEVDLAQQRARLAREFADLQDKRRMFESERTAWEAERDNKAQQNASAKPQRGVWRARLGLKDIDI